MNRFFRYTRVSPLDLCREAERRAWCCGAGMLLFFLAGAVGCLFCPIPAGDAFAAAGCDFAGVAVSASPPEPTPQEARPAVQLPAACVTEECLPELLLTPEPEPVAVVSPEWEEMEPVPTESPLACDLPMVLAAPAPRASDRSGGAAPAAAAEAHGPQGELVAASYRSAPPPPYPPELLSRRVQGRVGLRISVDAEGMPTAVEVSSSSEYPAFDRRAREWVLAHWRFHPARRGEVAVASIVRTQVEFVLR